MAGCGFHVWDNMRVIASIDHDWLSGLTDSDQSLNEYF
jgi:hypothetical protein